MKKIILGRRYDTETSEMVGSNGYSYPGQFEYWCETLYRKRTGEYFLHGEGGAMSKYAQSTDETHTGSGEQIIPMSEEEAREWAEENLDGDEYELAFPVIDDEEPGIAAKLGTIIAELRKTDGLNQPEFAQKCGTTQSMISSYETGRQDMTIARLADVAAALGLKPSELLAKIED